MSARYLFRRALTTGATLVCASVLIFAILHLSPGGPFDQRAFSLRPVDPGYLERLNHLIGLDQPLHVRYLNWLGALLQGDLGISWVVASGVPVSHLILQRLGNTLLLVGPALVLSLLLALFLGVFAALHRYSLADHMVTGLAYLGLSLPIFWLGLILVILFALWLPWLPTSQVATPGLEGDLGDRLRHLVLPLATLSVFFTAQWSRFVREGVTEAMNGDHVRTARAKGLPERLVVARHALRTGLIPLATVVCLALPQLFSGAIVTETVFSWAGMGKLYVDAVLASDWPVAMGLLLVTALMVVASSLLADLAYTALDPRVRYH